MARSVPSRARVRIGTSEARSPMPASEGRIARPPSGVKRSARSTTTIVPTRMISGANAWKSTSGRRNGVPCWMSELSIGGSLAQRGEHVAHRRHGRVGHLEDQVRVDAEGEDQTQHREPGDPLGAVQVGDVLAVELGLGGAERGALVEPQQVAGGEDGADGGDHHVDPEELLGEARRRVVGGEDGGELAPEPGQAGEAERGHCGEAEHPSELGGLEEDAAEPLDLEGVVAVLHRAGGEERSEEHTSELQSLMRISYAVFCLKKKKTTHE